MGQVGGVLLSLKATDPPQRLCGRQLFQRDHRGYQQPGLPEG